MAAIPVFLRGWFSRLLVLTVICMGFTAWGGMATAVRAIDDDYPDKRVEMVVPYSPGGGSDIFARTMTSMLEKQGIVDASINIVNREGGSGTIGGAYVRGKEGNNYVLMTVTSGILTNQLVLGTDVTYDDFTPIARLALDQLLIVVPDDSPFKGIEDLIEAGKAKPDEVTWGGTGLGGEDSLLLAQLEQESGANLNYVSFESGGEVQAALLGGHVDVASANPNEILGQLEAGGMRALAVAGEERLEALPDVPTLKEKGIEAVYEQLRGVFGPPNMDPEAVQFWADAFKQLSESEQWQEEYISENMLRSGYLPPEEFRTFLDEEYKKVESSIKEMGLGPEGSPATPAS